MRVVGISPLDKDATVSIVEDGKVLYAAAEERFSRNKQQDGFPRKSLSSALQYTDTKPEDVATVSYPFMDWQKEVELIRENEVLEKLSLDKGNDSDLSLLIREAQTRVPIRTDMIDGLHSPNESVRKGILYESLYSAISTSQGLFKRLALRGSRNWSKQATASFKHWQAELDLGLSEFNLSGKLKRMDHHLSHACNCFYTSGFERALIVTLDGYGTGLAGSISEGANGKVRRLHGVRFPNSLGTLYEQVTSSLGFKPGRHEGKIVGLASYGDPQVLLDVLLSQVHQDAGNYSIYGANNIYLSRNLAAKFPKIDVAAAYQRVLEVVAVNFIEYWVHKTGIDNVVLSGGVTANVKLNQRVFEIDGIKSMFVYPNMGDGGCGTGAALYHSWSGNEPTSITSAYLGPDFTEKEMENAIMAAGLTYSRPENLAGEVAQLINSGRVVARFDGRMEYGPRSLGNRSILYHAREPEVNQWLNKRLGRTEFMPFAPVTLFEARERCYHNIRGAEHAAEFMTITFDCTDEMKRMCPAAVHIDGTARPQLIKREVNPGYYDIVKAYEDLTGIPSLINTSFNMHEEPIVCSPSDAVRAFVEGRLDSLAMGPFLAEQTSPAPTTHV